MFEYNDIVVHLNRCMFIDVYHKSVPDFKSITYESYMFFTQVDGKWIHIEKCDTDHIPSASYYSFHGTEIYFWKKVA